MSVAYSRKESRPGDHVVVTAKATPGSYLGFLAVDESVLLMKKDNDLSHSKVSCHITRHFLIGLIK